MTIPRGHSKRPHVPLSAPRPCRHRSDLSARATHWPERGGLAARHAPHDGASDAGQTGSGPL